MQVDSPGLQRVKENETGALVSGPLHRAVTLTWRLGVRQTLAAIIKEARR